MSVIEMPLFVIVEDLISSACSLEFDLGFGTNIFWDFIRMTREGSLDVLSADHSKHRT
jgi:hypothetical protein